MKCYVMSCHVVDEFTLHFYACLQPSVPKLSAVCAQREREKREMLTVNHVKETGFVIIFTPLLIGRTKAAHIK